MKLHLLFLLTSLILSPFREKRSSKALLATYLLMTDRQEGSVMVSNQRRHDVFNGQQVNLNHKCTFPLYHLIVFNLIKVDLPEPLPLFDNELFEVKNIIRIELTPDTYAYHQNLPALKTISTNVN